MAECQMLTIDGSHGEGGGQILRTAVALSAIKKVPIKVENIRANRPKPGLKPQHLTAMRAAAELCGAELSGDSIGSQNIEFVPGEIRSGVFKFDIVFYLCTFHWNF